MTDKTVDFVITETKVKKRERSTRGYDKSYFADPRLYVFVEGETIIQNLYNRRRRPLKIYRQIARQALKQLGLDSTQKLAWSQKAGCSCGCSPGFKLKESRDVIASDIFVTVTGSEDLKRQEA